MIQNLVDFRRVGDFHRLQLRDKQPSWHGSPFPSGLTAPIVSQRARGATERDPPQQEGRQGTVRIAVFVFLKGFATKGTWALLAKQASQSAGPSLVQRTNTSPHARRRAIFLVRTLARDDCTRGSSVASSSEPTH